MGNIDYPYRPGLLHTWLVTFALGRAVPKRRMVMGARPPCGEGGFAGWGVAARCANSTAPQSARPGTWSEPLIHTMYAYWRKVLAQCAANRSWLDSLLAPGTALWKRLSRSDGAIV